MSNLRAAVLNTRKAFSNYCNKQLPSKSIAACLFDSQVLTTDGGVVMSKARSFHITQEFTFGPQNLKLQL